MAKVAGPKGYGGVDARQPIPGLSRSERDAAIVLGAFLIGMMVLLCTTVLALYFLSELPPIVGSCILFGVIVFAVVCGFAVLKSDFSPRHAGPPRIEFRAPVKRRRRSKSKGPRPLL